jgi:hypothetical protein
MRVPSPSGVLPSPTSALWAQVAEKPGNGLTDTLRAPTKPSETVPFAIIGVLHLQLTLHGGVWPAHETLVGFGLPTGCAGPAGGLSIT